MDKTIDFYTVKEVAEILRLSEWSVYEAIRQKLLPSVRIGRKVRVEVEAFRAWVADGGMSYEAVDRQAS